MIARPLPARTGQDAIRLVRALGAHRYVSGRLHVIHAFAFDALGGEDESGQPRAALAEARRWARDVLSDPSIELDSKDPRLFRHASPEELLGVLEGFWVPGRAADVAHERLLDALDALGLGIPIHVPFDETVEDDLHPLLVDAGWELLSLAELDPVRHRGVIEAYGEPIHYEAARFEEENAIPRRAPLQELPALGVVELVRGVDATGELVEPLVLWTEGDEVYQDYLLRGVERAAKLTP